MLTSVVREKCGECSGEICDLGDELVCRSCGVVTEKQVVETRSGGPLQAIDFTGQALGGYLGAIDSTYGEKFSRGFSKTPSSYKYLKLVSDYACREDSTVYSCAKMIERVCEKLLLPNVVMGQAVVLSKKLFELKRRRTDINSAAVSAFSIMTACKIARVTSVNVREIIRAHQALGRRVKMSAIIRLALDSPFSAPPRRPEDYLTKVLGKLSSTPAIAAGLRAGGSLPSTYLGDLLSGASALLADAEDTTKAGHSPCALAATAVYAAEVLLASKEGRKKILTQREVARCGDVAEYTVREQYAEIFRPIGVRVGRQMKQIPLAARSS